MIEIQFSYCQFPVPRYKAEFIGDSLPEFIKERGTPYEITALDQIFFLATTCAVLKDIPLKDITHSFVGDVPEKFRKLVVRVMDSPTEHTFESISLEAKLD